MGRAPLGDKPKNKSRPVRVLVTDSEHELLDAAAAKPRGDDGRPAFRGTGTWARDLLLAFAGRASEIDDYCQQHGLGTVEFLELAIGHQLARKRPK